MKKIMILVLALSITLSVFGFAGIVSANHSWGNFHWARTSNPFTLQLGKNLTSGWASYLTTTSNDWSASNVLDTVVVTGSSNPRTCKPVLGRVEVCNSKYGNNGWLGIAQIWTSDGTHIVQAVTKLNDSYFNTRTYNTPAWKNLVMCQEVGHTLGLNHQDEVFGNINLDTCMDYTNDPTSNQHPNAHDYEQLEAIYAHLDTTTTVGASLSGANKYEGSNSASDWGKAIASDKSGNDNVFKKEFADGSAVYTHVFWAEDGHDHDHE